MSNITTISSSDKARLAKELLGWKLSDGGPFNCMIDVWTDNKGVYQYATELSMDNSGDILEPFEPEHNWNHMRLVLEEMVKRKEDSAYSKRWRSGEAWSAFFMYFSRECSNTEHFDLGCAVCKNALKFLDEESDTLCV